MRAGVMIVRNPFDPLAARETRMLRRPRRVRALVPRNRPFIAILNGKPLLRAGWRRRLRDGDILVICALPRGGGGRGGSNPLRLVLSLSLLFFAPQLSTLILGETLAATTLFGTYTYGQATTLGIALVGNAAINALLPAPQPSQAQTPSPTYDLQAQSNQARIEQAIPVQYGRLRVHPDLAAQPYAEYAGNEQYLYQLLCLGAGEYDIEDIRIEDTPISAFSEIEAQIVRPGEAVTLFPTAVVSSVEVSGQELLPRKRADWSQTGTTVTITEENHNRAVGQAIVLETDGNGPNGKFRIATVVDEGTFTVEATSGSGSGSAFVFSIQGGLDGFVAAGAGTVAHRLAVDLIMPAGLYTWSSGGDMRSNEIRVIIEAQRIDDNGDPMGAWFELGNEYYNDRTTTPLRETVVYDLQAPGRYRVRAWRVDERTAATGAGHEIVLAGLRSYLVDDEAAGFGPVTLIAMRMRATNNLSLQASRKVSVVATRKLPVWNGSTWTAPVVTRSIAWAIADAARNGDYGAGLPDSRVDLDALLALDAVWSDRGDQFDGRFDQSASWWEAVSQIALAGRARVFMQGGKLRVVRDGADALPVAMYSMRNIVKGSFAIDYIMPSEDTADAIEVLYYDATTWAPRRVTAALPDSSAGTPAKLDLTRGITSRDQAMREGLYHAASNRYRRRVIRFSTEMEGFLPSIGDTIAVAHDTPGWGQHAEAVSWDAATRTLTLSEPVSFGAGTHYVALRAPGGGVSGPWPVSPGATPQEVVLSEAPDITPYTGTERERTHVAFGEAETYATMAKVLTVRPRSEYEVEIEAVPDDPSVHSAETGAVAAPIRTSQLPPAVVRPVVERLFARRMPGDSTRVLLAWQPAVGAEGYQIEMAEGSDVTDPGVSWTRVADTSASHQAVRLLHSARTLIRVRGTGLAAGPWTGAALGDLIPNLWNTDPTPMWTLDPNAMWSS